MILLFGCTLLEVSRLFSLSLVFSLVVSLCLSLYSCLSRSHFIHVYLCRSLAPSSDFSISRSLVGSLLQFRCQSWTVHLADGWAGRGVTVCAQVDVQYALEPPAPRWTSLHAAIVDRDTALAEWWVDWMTPENVGVASPSDVDHPICNKSPDIALVA
jgi:hypothetical protein